MSNGADVVSQDRKDDQGSGGQAPADSEVPSRETRPREEVAREIGSASSSAHTPAGGAPSGGASAKRAGGKSKPGAGRGSQAARQELEDGGPLRLDKSGALAGRKKLKPVKAHQKSAERETAAAAASAQEPTAGEAPAASSKDRAASGAAAKALRQEDRQDARPSARPRKASLPPKLGTLRPEGAAAKRAEVAAEVSIPAGSFLYGEDKSSRELSAFQIDRAPVTNADYELFVTATGHRPPLYWAGSSLPPEADLHPVVGVDYYDALAYARWKGQDLPFEDEWERAVRGTDGRAYPWGDDQELSGANTARVGLRMTVPFDLHRENVSPEGCRDMVGNAWEITHSPAPGGGVVVRGGSWYDFALYAKTFFRFASQPDARNGTIGFRCCRRASERPEAPREIDLALVDAEIAARRGGEPPVDAGTWSPERRDLVIDVQRLRTFVAETRAEALLGAAAVVKPPRPVLRTVDAVTLQDETPTPAADTPAAAAPEREEKEGAEAVAPPPSASPSAETPSEEKRPDEKQPDEKRLDEKRSEQTSSGALASEEEATPARIHVGSPTKPRKPTVGGGSPAWGRATSDVARAEAKKSRTRPAVVRSMPLTMWILLAAGFLLFGGLLVVLVNLSDETPEPVSYLPDAYVVDPEEDERRSPLADLPDMPPYDAFPWSGEPPRVIDLADRSQGARLEKGLWMLVFVEPEGLGAGRTIQTAHAMHRRMAAGFVNVAVVMPRARYEAEGGALLPEDRLSARLKADGSRSEGGNFLWDGIPIVLEPADASGRGLLRLRTGSPDAGVATVLLYNGQLETRVTPLKEGYTEASLVGLARRALEIQGDR